MSESIKFSNLEIGGTLVGREYRCDNVQLMMYNASLWNGHRIHYDAPYTKDVEGYPGLVIAGPLIGDWLSQCVMEWLGEAGELRRFSYSNRQAAYVGDTLRSSGTIAALDADSREASIELKVSNDAGELITPGAAVVRFLRA